MGYKHDFSSGAVEFIIPPPPGITTGPASPVKAAMEPGSVQERVKEAVRQQSYQEVFDVKVFRCTCQRCPKIWITMQQLPPKTCPNCKSPWWQERPSGYMNPEMKAARMNKKKKGKKRLKAGYIPSRGRPPKNAYEDVGAEWSAGGGMVLPEEIPEVPVALLGAMDQPADAFDQGYAGTAVADEEDFPVATPFDTPAPRPTAVDSIPDPQLPTGQPTDVGGCESFASEVLPPPALDPDLDGPPTAIDDDWDRFGP
jgi:hypothetical protein